MKIVFANFASSGNWGGGENWTIRSARGLADRGHEVLVIGRTGSDMFRRARDLKLEAKEINVNTDYSLNSILKLKRIIKSFSTDVVIVHHNRDVRTAGIAAKLAGVAVVHRNGFPVIHNNLRHRFTQLFVDRILTNSARIKEKYLQYGWMNKDKFDVIPNGYFQFDLSDVDANLYDEFDISENKLVCIYAGRLTGVKRVEDLISAFEMLSDESKWHLVIFGAGSYENQILCAIKNKKLEHRITFAGFRENVQAYFKQANLVALPSSDEGMPNTLMESMALGIAVAATPVGDVEYLLNDGKAGYIVEVGDIQGWQKLLSNLEADITALDHMAKAGHERIRNHFTFDKMIEGIESSLRTAIEEWKH